MKPILALFLLYVNAGFVGNPKTRKYAEERMPGPVFAALALSVAIQTESEPNVPEIPVLELHGSKTDVTDVEIVSFLVYHAVKTISLTPLFKPGLSRMILQRIKKPYTIFDFSDGKQILDNQPLNKMRIALPVNDANLQQTFNEPCRFIIRFNHTENPIRYCLLTYRSSFPTYLYDLRNRF